MNSWSPISTSTSRPAWASLPLPGCAGPSHNLTPAGTSTPPPTLPEQCPDVAHSPSPWPASSQSQSLSCRIPCVLAPTSGSKPKGSGLKAVQPLLVLVEKMSQQLRIRKGFSESKPLLWCVYPAFPILGGFPGSFTPLFPHPISFKTQWALTCPTATPHPPHSCLSHRLLLDLPQADLLPDWLGLSLCADDLEAVATWVLTSVSIDSLPLVSLCVPSTLSHSTSPALGDFFLVFCCECNLVCVCEH